MPRTLFSREDRVGQLRVGEADGLDQGGLVRGLDVDLSPGRPTP